MSIKQPFLTDDSLIMGNKSIFLPMIILSCIENKASRTKVTMFRTNEIIAINHQNRNCSTS